MLAAGLAVVEFVLCLLMAASLLAAVLTLGIALADALIGPHRTGLTLRLTAIAVAIAAVLSAAFQLLLVLHAFTLPWAFALLTVGALTVVRTRRGLLTPFRPLSRWWRTRPWRRGTWLVAPAVIGVLAVRALFVPPVTWDALTYHLVKAALWVQGGRPIRFRAPGGGGLFMGFPGGVDALWAWVMLPFHSDFLVGVADVLGFGLLGLSVYTLGRAVGLRSREAGLAGLFVLSMPAALLAAGNNYADNLTAFYLIAATTATLRYLRGGDAGWAAVAGISAGLAAGAKLTALPVVAIVLAALVWRAWRTRPAQRYVPLFAGLAAFAMCAPWYVENWINLGHPFSPYPIRIAGLVLGDSPEFVRLPTGPPYTWAEESRALFGMFHTPFWGTFGPIAVAPFLLVPVGLVRLWRRHRSSAALLAVLIAYGVQTYLSPQYTVARLLWSQVGARHFLHVAAIAVVLSLTVLRGPFYTALLSIAIALNVWVHGALYWTPLELDLVSGYVVVLWLAAWILSRFESRAARRVAAIALSVVGLALGAWGRSAFRHTLAATATLTHKTPHFSEAALAAVDRGRPLRLAFTAGPYAVGDNWMIYPFLGSRLQNEPVYVPISHSGRLVNHTDPAYRTDTDVDAWLGRLEAANVDAVVSLAPPGPEMGWMAARPALFQYVAGEPNLWAVYARVRRGTPAAP